jgi:ribosomal protein S12 methylthiotransferase
VQSEIAYKLNQEMVGNSYKVLIDREESDVFYGRTEYDSPEVDNEVIFTANKKLIVGEFVKAKIVKADYFDLYGEV